MRRRNNSQEVLQNTDGMCMGNAICSLRKNLNSLHGHSRTMVVWRYRHACAIQHEPGRLSVHWH